MDKRVTLTFLCAGSPAAVPAAQAARVADQLHLLAQQVAVHGGHVVNSGPHSIAASFNAASAALAAARVGQQQLTATLAGSQLALALTAGQPEKRDFGSAGPIFQRCMALLAAAHPGQVLLAQSAVDAALGDGAALELLDLGSQRLGDLLRPAHVSQLVAPGLAQDFPPLRTLNAYQHNLPVQPTSMVGRETEVAALAELLQRADLRLLTLLGTSGTGKTRLSIQVAATLLPHFADGVFFVPLAPVSNPAVVISTIAQTLDVQESSTQNLFDTLAEHLAERQLLLVLDNFEQVLETAPQLVELLERTQQLKLLVTSQAALNVPSEQTFTLPPLAVPSLASLPALDEIAATPAVALFIECAQLCSPTFDLTKDNAPAVVELCSRLAGLPLAIELVAANSNLFSPQGMLAILRDTLDLNQRTQSSREHTLRHVLDWSYSLLDSEAQALFSRLGVFSGGCTLADAEAVCYETGNLVKDVLEGVDMLLNKHLLLQEELADSDLRYIMLDAVHEYALKQLQQREETTRFKQRHAEYYLELAEAAEPALKGPDQESWLRRFESENHNLRAALVWFAGQGQRAHQLRLAGALGRFWMLHGHFGEGRQWLTAALAHSAGVAPEVHSRALRALGLLALFQGDYAEATALHQASLAIERQLNTLPVLASVLNNLGVISATQGLYHEAIAYWDECQAIQRQAGDLAGSADTLNNLGVMAHEQGDYAQASAYYEQSLALCRELGDLASTAISLQNLGELALIEQDVERATALLNESLALSRRLGDTLMIASTLHDLALLAFAQHEFQQAHSLFTESLGLRAELGDRRGMASAFEGLAWIQARHDRERAVKLLSAATALRTALNAPLTPIEQPKRDELHQLLQSSMPAASFASAWEAGQTLALEDVCALA